MTPPTVNQSDRNRLQNIAIMLRDGDWPRFKWDLRRELIQERANILCPVKIGGTLYYVGLLSKKMKFISGIITSIEPSIVDPFYKIFINGISLSNGDTLKKQLQILNNGEWDHIPRSGRKYPANR